MQFTSGETFAHVVFTIIGIMPSLSLPKPTIRGNKMTKDRLMKKILQRQIEIQLQMLGIQRSIFSMVVPVHQYQVPGHVKLINDQMDEVQTTLASLLKELNDVP